MRGGLRRWADPGWWGYLRYEYPERLLVAGALAAVVLAVAGYLSVAAFGNRGTASVGLLTTTANGHVRVLHVVRTLAQVETRTLPGGTRVKVQRFVHYKPVYRRKVVLVNGKPVTVKKLIGRRAVTVSNVVTSSRTSTVVQSHTQTVSQTQTVTRTQSSPSQTVTVSVTITEPGTTLTETVPTTITVTTSCQGHHC
jgi:hypothetical protein